MPVGTEKIEDAPILDGVSANGGFGADARRPEAAVVTAGQLLLGDSEEPTALLLGDPIHKNQSKPSRLVMSELERLRDDGRAPRLASRLLDSWLRRSPSSTSLLWPLTAAAVERIFSLFVCGGVVRHSLHAAQGPWRRSPLVALRARESGTPTRSGVGSLGLDGRARQLRPSVI